MRDVFGLFCQFERGTRIEMSKLEVWAMRWLMVSAAAVALAACGAVGAGKDAKLVEIPMVDPGHYDLPDGLSDSGMFPGRFRWAGRPEELARLVADRVRYDFVVSGPVKDLPVLKLDLTSPMPAHILAVEAQRLGAKAKLRLDTAERRITLEAKGS
jgi:hypothetical protein